jgi:hypothetical protein
LEKYGIQVKAHDHSPLPLSRAPPQASYTTTLLRLPGCLGELGNLSPVLKIARLGLPLEHVRDVLDDLRTFGRWDMSHGMPEGLTACGSQHHGQRMERDTGLLPAVHQSRNLPTQGDDLWRIIIMGRQVRSSRHRLSSGVMWWIPPRH